MSLLEENWQTIKNRVILPLWNGRFKSMYEAAKLDYSDFESLAGIELTKAMKTFDPEKANLLTYSAKVVSQKALTELRNCTRRDKRKALHTATNIESDSDSSMSYTIDNHNMSEFSDLRVGGFVNSLDNNQLRVLILSLLNFDTSDMPSMLNISKSTAQSILRSLKDTDLTRVLYRRNFQ